MATGSVSQYRARNPRATLLYRLFDSLYDEVRGQWEERFERRYGFWRGFVDEQVKRYLDCGLFENGFARVRCPERGLDTWADRVHRPRCRTLRTPCLRCRRPTLQTPQLGHEMAQQGAPTRRRGDPELKKRLDQLDAAISRRS